MLTIFADGFARFLPGARVETVERSGHAWHLDQPETVARMVRAFLRE